MSSNVDYYAVLGVLPDAEHVVIIAAYRALCSKYHPDRWMGDSVAATQRMAAINVAYGVLSDTEKRRAYDSTRSSKRGSFSENDDENEAAFDEALTEVEARWQIAVQIYQDLADLRKRLNRTSHRLGFSFVTLVLETKRFSERYEIADGLELSFLSNYFGTDPEIIGFVKGLIAAGQRDAVKAVNRFIEVLGTSTPASVIIGKVDAQFNLGIAEKARAAALERERQDAAWRKSRRAAEVEREEQASREFSNLYVWFARFWVVLLLFVVALGMWWH